WRATCERANGAGRSVSSKISQATKAERTRGKDQERDVARKEAKALFVPRKNAAAIRGDVEGA
ncbi:MAG: hypothetical protein ACQEUH_15185, partial [Pseudomonadota bacterium]